MKGKRGDKCRVSLFYHVTCIPRIIPYFPWNSLTLGEGFLSFNFFYPFHFHSCRAERREKNSSHPDVVVAWPLWNSPCSPLVIPHTIIFLTDLISFQDCETKHKIFLVWIDGACFCLFCGHTYIQTCTLKSSADQKNLNSREEWESEWVFVCFVEPCIKSQEWFPSKTKAKKPSGTKEEANHNHNYTYMYSHTHTIA